MKKIVFGIFILCLLCSLDVEASWGYGYKYVDGGAIYTGTTFPQSAGKDTNSETKPELYRLKKGEASSRNMLQLIEIGNSGINQAARNGGIKKIHYVDTATSKVYIPLGFIPIYAKETKTIVYGE